MAHCRWLRGELDHALVQATQALLSYGKEKTSVIQGGKKQHNIRL